MIKTTTSTTSNSRALVYNQNTQVPTMAATSTPINTLAPKDTKADDSLSGIGNAYLIVSKI